MKLISAIALDRPREVSTRFGPRLVIDCRNRDTGEKITLWRSVDDDYSKKFVVRDMPITVSVDSKGKFNLIENPEHLKLGQPLPAESVPVKAVHNYDHKITQNSEKSSEKHSETFTTDEKRAIASYIGDMADLFNFCLKTVDQRVENITPDDRRQVATSLFIATQKRFNI
ncbi:hypothetical protein [Microcystis aeruginosa]|uniref:hypothetical protein n=1 Tax=Microcystis aeruginosa TaxID=1126 RepID=UPI00188128DD|nr:hypothetical protein [Microcystis aeruginosa]MBE8996157.1 hypothetical protein [Microcystis aeruginosa LEGE 91341]